MPVEDSGEPVPREQRVDPRPSPQQTPQQTTTVKPVSTLVERLGHPGSTRLVILSCRGLGCSHAANTGCYDALRTGIATSAGLMVPCPWAREAASRYRGEDIGVSLTLNAEHELYRWGPITQAPSLLDGNGGFPQTVSDTWDHADLDEVRRECRSQIERAVFWGFDVSHLDSHIGVLELRPEFFDLYVDLALEFQLPMRLPGPDMQQVAGFPFRDLARDEGVLFTDHAIDIGPNPRREFERALENLQPGVTEIRLWPAIETDELRALDRSWQENVEHHHLLTHDEDARTLLRRTGAVVTDYRALRSAQRAT